MLVSRFTNNNIHMHGNALNIKKNDTKELLVLKHNGM